MLTEQEKITVEQITKIEDIHDRSIKINALALSYTKAISEATRTNDPTKFATSLGYLEQLGSEIAHVKWRVAQQVTG